MSNVVQLPTASGTYVELRQFGRGWVVETVTTIRGSQPLRNRMAKAALYTHGLHFARKMAREKGRWLKHPDGWEGVSS